MDYIGGFITKNPVLPNGATASGVFKLSQVQQFITQGLWPGSGYKVIQSFTATGTWTCPAGVTQVDYLVVAGGGGGGWFGAGGGGAGGFRAGTGLSVTAGTTYTVTVGAGGATGSGTEITASSRGANGADSIFSTITSTGGGGGGSGY